MQIRVQTFIDMHGSRVLWLFILLCVWLLLLLALLARVLCAACIGWHGLCAGLWEPLALVPFSRLLSWQMARPRRQRRSRTSSMLGFSLPFFLGWGCFQWGKIWLFGFCLGQSRAPLVNAKCFRRNLMHRLNGMNLVWVSIAFCVPSENAQTMCMCRLFRFVRWETFCIQFTLQMLPCFNGIHTNGDFSERYSESENKRTIYKTCHLKLALAWKRLKSTKRVLPYSYK